MTEEPRILYHHRTRGLDGQAVHVRALIAALRGRGCPVREAALVPLAEPPGVPRAGAPRGSLLGRARAPRWLAELGERAYNATAGPFVLRAAAGWRPQLLYERHALHLTAGARAASRLGIPYFLEVNSPMCLEMGRLGLLRFPRSARAAEGFVLDRADRVFAVSSVLAQLLVEAGAPRERVVVNPNGADPEAFAAARSRTQAWRSRMPGLEGRQVVGFVGFPRPWHRLDLLLEALAVLRREGLDGVALLVVGDGPVRGPMEERARALGLEGRLAWTGALAREEVPAAMGLMDVAAIPAINGYACPLKLFDALAAGVACVAPDQPNLRELVRDGETASLFRPGDAGDLARALKSLLGDGEARRNMEAAGKTWAARHTWAERARRVVEEYHRVREAR